MLPVFAGQFLKELFEVFIFNFDYGLQMDFFKLNLEFHQSF